MRYANNILPSKFLKFGNLRKVTKYDLINIISLFLDENL